MKNQYVGDIGDFGKYSMLRAFIDAGIKVGVNWYLTEDDGSNDGKFTDYLNKGVMRRYCSEVFDALQRIRTNLFLILKRVAFSLELYFIQKFLNQRVRQMIESRSVVVGFRKACMSLKIPN